MIPESHPLQQLFQDLVGRHYAEEIGIRDPQIVAYVSHLLAEFCEADQFFKIHDASKFEHFEYARVAPLFASLSKNFEGCVYGLNMVKNDLEEMQHPIVRRADDLIM